MAAINWKPKTYMTTWGAQRARDGHAAPFKLTYVEIGNEDWFDKSGSYDARFAQFYDAIKAKYPELQIISTIGYDQPEAKRVHSRKPDMMDEHYYRATDEFVRMSPDYARDYDRTGPKPTVRRRKTRRARDRENRSHAVPRTAPAGHPSRAHVAAQIAA